MTSLLVGCPITRRLWALPHYFASVEQACSVAGMEPVYVFVTDPREAELQTSIDYYTRAYRRPVFRSWIEEPVDAPDRNWTDPERIHRMVYLRNLLLQQVRELEAPLFLSLDSDIFLHPSALKDMISMLDRFDAVGSKTYMEAAGTMSPSFAFIENGQSLFRYDTDASFAVDAIMAIKLMLPVARNIDYVFHPKGEDVGWSLACKEAGVKLGWDGGVCSKHAMSPEAVTRIDRRCGF